MNIDFIKWMIGYAEGYSLREITMNKITVSIIDYGEDKERIDTFLSCNSIARSHLLIRAIEGINKLHLNDDKYPIIDIDCHDINVWYVLTDVSEVFNLEDYESIDDAKEQALNYIYKQE